MSTWQPAIGMSPGCEPLADGLLTEPVAAVTSLAFVAAAAAIPIVVRRGRPVGAEDQPGVTGYALLVGAVGVGSVIQHGPDPPWSDLAHDTPLLATLVFVAADAVAGLTGRRRAWWWWAAPTAAILPLVLAAPRAGDLAQAGLAAVAIGLTLARARARPALRRRVVGALALLAVGGTIGTLSRRGGPLCVPESIWQGHAAWHVLASVALVVLAPVIGRRGTAGRLGEVPRRLP